MADYDRWEVIGEPLGEGGQGTVYLARKPERAEYLKQIEKAVETQLRQINGSPAVNIASLAQQMVELGSSDGDSDLGALKIFKIRNDNKKNKEEEKKSVERLESEVEALDTISHPAVLKLFYSNIDKRFIVTEFHKGGTLDKHLHTFRGNVLGALEAFKPLVAGLSEIHSNEMVHRDIKPENIFVANSGRLVLGDFGIVFFRDASGDRKTTTYERAGSRYWMAPWADANVRLELSKINPKLDIYPLAKVLWSMIAGKNGFSFWDYNHDENNLERMFPETPGVFDVNRLLSKCLVRDEKDCVLKDASELLAEIDVLTGELQARKHSYRKKDAPRWPCRVCGRGAYESRRGTVTALRAGMQKELAVYMCDKCYHVELFSTDGTA